MKPVLSVAKWVAAVALLAWWIISITSGRTAESITNPFVLDRADAQTFRYNGAYYFTATVPEADRIILRRSLTLAGLSTAPESVIWSKHAAGEMSAHIWSPEIHRIRGKWYVYFTAGRANEPSAARLYVLENADVDPTQGAWSELGKIATDFDSFSADATTFAHKGVRYLLWAQRPEGLREAGTNLYLARMKNPWALDGPQIAIASQVGDLDAPAFIEHGGQLFITYTANEGIGLLSAPANADLLKPSSWTKSARPVFEPAGHNAFLLTTDGRTDLLLYRDSNRNSRVQPFTWRDNGTPDFGTPAPDGVIQLNR